MNIGSIATAMVTPFQTDGSINYAQVELLIEHLLATGTDSLVISGTKENLLLYHPKKN